MCEAMDVVVGWSIAGSCFLVCLAMVVIVWRVK